MTNDTQRFSPNDELDLTGEGLQPTDGTFLIVKTEIQENDMGQRWSVTFEPVDGEIDGLMGNKVQDGGYLTHVDREELVKIGRGSLKRLGSTVLGREVFKLNELEGQQVRARVSEDKSGFARIGRYSKA